MFGLVPVHGTFGTYGGTLEADTGGARGELRIEASTLDTGNDKRDVHLRSADFFDVAAHPTVRFSLAGLGAGPDGGLTLTGLLRIKDTELRIEAPVRVTGLSDDRMSLETTISVDRTAAGVGWSKMGMIRGRAHLHASITLVRG